MNLIKILFLMCLFLLNGCASSQKCITLVDESDSVLKFSIYIYLQNFNESTSEQLNSLTDLSGGNKGVLLASSNNGIVCFTEKNRIFSIDSYKIKIMGSFNIHSIFVKYYDNFNDIPNKIIINETLKKSK